MVPDSILQTIVEKGLTVGVAVIILVFTVQFLFKKILGQYEERLKEHRGRIEACEKENEECRSDRKELHNKIHSLLERQADRAALDKRHQE